MDTYYAAETIARQRTAEVARNAERAWMTRPSRRRRRHHAPRPPATP
jgi:hypothetical protein